MWINRWLFLTVATLSLIGLTVVFAHASVDPLIQVKGGEVVERGIASQYGYNTGAPACGIPMRGNVAAHKTLPCGSQVRVTRGDRSVVVTIIDRGPFVRGRIIDLAPEPARRLGLMGTIGYVTLERVK